MKPIELNIYWLSGEQVQLRDLGVDNDDDFIDTRRMTFYSIEHIGEYDPRINAQPASRIFSGGQDYLTDMDYESLKTLINESYES